MLIRDRSRQRGFTLIELMMVILLIGMIASVATPRLLPLLTITEHENEARRLVGYGRSAMAHAALTRKPIRVRIDLDRQEYWAEEMPQLIRDPETESSGYGADDDDKFDDDVPEDEYELQETTKKILRDNEKKNPSFTARDRDRDREEDNDEDELDSRYDDEEARQSVLDKQKEKMEERFRSMSDNSLYARALRVQHDDEWTDEDRFDLDEFRKDEEEDLDDEDIPKPLNDPLLQAHRVIETVWIDTIYIGEEEYSKGVVDIELSPLGLENEVTFAVFNEENDLLMVYWDPLSGSAWYGRPVEEQ